MTDEMMAQEMEYSLDGYDGEVVRPVIFSHLNPEKMAQKVHL